MLSEVWSIIVLHGVRQVSATVVVTRQVGALSNVTSRLSQTLKVIIVHSNSTRSTALFLQTHIIPA